MRRIVACLLMIIFLCSCSGGGTRIKIDSEKIETDTIKITTQIPRFSGMYCEGLQNELNEKYKTDINKWVEDFKKEYGESSVNAEEILTLDIKQSVKYNKNSFISIVSEIYRFTGGAHGMSAWVSKNIDDSDCKVISLANLFNENEDYKTILNRQMEKIIEQNANEYQDLWEQPMITDDQGFYIENGDLVIYYAPYELSYYARGFVEFRIPLQNIEGYIKQQYKRLI